MPFKHRRQYTADMHIMLVAEPDLPPSPLLVIATSDAKLRLYTISHLKRQQQLEGVVQPAARVLDVMPRMLSVAASLEMPTLEQVPAARAVAAAAAARLPESDEDELTQSAGKDGDGELAAAAEAELPESGAGSEAEEGSETEGSEAAAVAAAAGAQLPESDEDSLEEDSWAAAAPQSSAEAAQLAASTPAASAPATSGQQHRCTADGNRLVRLEMHHWASVLD